MSSVIVSPPNGILFILDPKNKDILVPEYVDDELIATTDSCISIGTQAPVDGEIEVSMNFSKVNPSDLHLIAIGDISVPHGQVAVVTSDFEKLLELDVPIGRTPVSIWVDDVRNPAKIIINIANRDC